MPESSVGASAARRHVRFSSFVLAFLLTPTLLESPDCGLPGDASLASLVVETSTGNLIGDFQPEVLRYEVETQDGDVLVRVETSDPAAKVSYELNAGTNLLQAGLVGSGGEDLPLWLPVGHSALVLEVSAPEGRLRRYIVSFTRVRTFACTEEGLQSAVRTSGGPNLMACDEPTTVVVRDEMVIDRDVIIDGAGLLTVEGISRERLFFVAAHAKVELIGMKLIKGAAENGGAILNEGRTTLRGVQISSNEAEWRGGGVYSGPGGELTLIDTVVENNVATGTSEALGGGLHIDGGSVTLIDSVVRNNTARGYSAQGGRRAQGGGVYVWQGEVALESSLIADNATIGGDGSGEYDGAGSAWGGGLNLVDSFTTIADSTVRDNECLGGYAYRGGGFASGGGINVDGGTLNMVGTTIAHNFTDGMTGRWEAGASGGLRVGPYSDVVVLNSTVSGNRSDRSEAIDVFSEARVAFYNSTIAFNSTDETRSAFATRSNSEVTFSHTIVSNVGGCSGFVQSLGHNVFSPSFDCRIEGDPIGDVIGDPQLQPLADNGGPTMTHALSEGSPAVDAGDPAGCMDDDGQAITKDQRGAERPVGVCDVGAVEAAGH